MKGDQESGAVRSAVKARYGRVARDSGSCCAPSCCGDAEGTRADEVSKTIGYTDDELRSVPPDANLGLGCGNPTAIASLVAGETVLDLGSGAGIDCFLAAGRVGPQGRVIGVDMTPEMINRARATAAAGGYGNVDFRLGEIEALPVEDGSVDVIISNCVLNLSTAKDRALAEAHRVLRAGGRIVVSDMVSELPVPGVLENSLDAVAGCLPTHRERYLAEFRGSGFSDVRITEERAYPTSHVLSDPGVRRFIASHPEEAYGIQAFAGSIVGAVFEATKT